MKVYVTQGHQTGIGLEVFFKSCLFLGRDIRKLHLLAYKKSVAETLESMRLPLSLFKDLEITWLDTVNHSESFTSLELGMRLAETNGVLYTLPTSKDQFPGFAGHTEFFRSFYRKPELGMFFSSPKYQVLLISDHIPLKDVTKTLTSDIIEARLKEAILSFEKWNWKIDRILVAGFNPHAGEGGMIGDEDERVKLSIQRLRKKFGFEMSGPLPGDTMLLEQKSAKDLLVYLYHDQGLAPFKGSQGFIGANITLGLPYPRVSPDHGTSFKLFGKNEADYRGCAFSLKEALKLLEGQGNGKNSGHKGQGTQLKKH